MHGAKNGKLVLQQIPEGEKTDEIIDYLAAVFQKAPPGGLARLVKQTPVVLSRNIPALNGRRIAFELRKRGAVAVFMPHQTCVEKSERMTKNQSKNDLEKKILEKFTGNLPRMPVSFLYRLGIFLTGFFMLLLPVVYVGLIGSLVLILYRHLTGNLPGVLSAGSISGILLFYLAPAVIGILLILFMIKPLFSRPQKAPSVCRADPESEPLLFSFVQKIAELTGAPPPAEIHFDLDVNAAAMLRRPFVSLFRKDLTLTIGLSLAAGFDLNQFAGVIAHEFGHFTQSAGMRMTYLTRAVIFWLDRVVNEEDQWDKNIRRWSRESDFRFALILLAARFFIWSTRKILYLFLLLGHMAGCYMLRLMEYDADRYEIALVGTEVFISTEKRLAVLNSAWQKAFRDLEDAWRDGRLAENLPELVCAKAIRMPENKVMDLLQKEIFDSRTVFFDTHPAPTDRIEKAGLFNPDPVFHITAKDLGKGREKSVPASILFSDFDGLAKKLSLEYYENIIGEKIPPEQLISSEIIRKRQETESRYLKSLSRFFLDQFSTIRPVGFSEDFMKIPEDIDERLRKIVNARKHIRASVSVYRVNLKRLFRIMERKITLSQAQTLIDAGISVSAGKIKLNRPLPEAVSSEFDLLNREETKITRKLIGFESAIRFRISCTLSLIHLPSIAAKIRNAQAMEKQAALFLNAARILESVFPELDTLRRLYRNLYLLVIRMEGNEIKTDFMAQLKLKAEDTRICLDNIRKELLGAAYPLDHAREGLTLDQYLVGVLPGAEDFHNLIHLGDTTLERTLELYSRVCARIAHIALTIEKAAGMEDLFRQYPASD